MFSSQANTQDLYFNNPMDHFLGPESQKRCNTESGFSSGLSCTQSGSLKEVFSFGNVFETPMEEKPQSQFGAGKPNYQNYISQNLILGSSKNPPPNVLSSKGQRKYGEDFSERKTTFPAASSFEASYDIIKEIRTIGEMIQKNAQKNELLMLSMKDVREEVANFRNDIKMMKENQAKLLKQIGENHDCIGKDFKSLSNKISENTQDVKHVKVQVEKYHDELTDGQQIICKQIVKDVGKELKELSKHINDTMTEAFSEIHNFLTSLKNSFEETLHQKFCDLKAMVSFSSKKPIENTDEYLQHQNILSSQRMGTINRFRKPSIYDFAKSRLNFEDDYVFRDTNLNSTQYLNSSTHSGNNSGNVLHKRILPQETSALKKELQNEFKKHVPTNSYEFKTEFSLGKKCNEDIRKIRNRRQNTSCLNAVPIRLPKTQMKYKKETFHAANSGVSNSDARAYKTKLRSRKPMVLQNKEAFTYTEQNRKNNCSKNKKQNKKNDCSKNKNQKKRKDCSKSKKQMKRNDCSKNNRQNFQSSTMQNQNNKIVSTKILNTSVIRDFQCSSKNINASDTLNQTLFSASITSSPGLSVYEAINLKRNYVPFFSCDSNQFENRW